MDGVGNPAPANAFWAAPPNQAGVRSGIQGSNPVESLGVSIKNRLTRPNRGGSVPGLGATDRGDKVALQPHPRPFPKGGNHDPCPPTIMYDSPGTVIAKEVAKDESLVSQPVARKFLTKLRDNQST